MNLNFLESTGKGTERETAAACQTVQRKLRVEHACMVLHPDSGQFRVIDFRLPSGKLT